MIPAPPDPGCCPKCYAPGTLEDAVRPIQDGPTLLAVAQATYACACGWTWTTAAQRAANAAALEDARAAHTQRLW